VLHDVVFTVLALIASAITSGLLTRWVVTRGRVQTKQLETDVKKSEHATLIETKRIDLSIERTDLADRLLDRITALEKRNTSLATQLDEQTRRLRSRVSRVEDSEERLRHRLRTNIEGWEDTGKHSVPSMPAVNPHLTDVVKQKPAGAHIVGAVRKKPTPR
jgi:hypothetical protein